MEIAKAVEFALNALNEFNSNTNFSPRTTVFFKNAVTGSSHMNSMSSTIKNGLQRQAALPHFFAAFSPNLTALKLKISNFE